MGNESAVEHFSAVLDNTSPALQGSIEAPSNGTYVDTGAGSVLEFALSYDEDVVVGGTPFLSLDIGGQSRSASYVGASSTARRLVFRYAVQAVDSDSDGITWDGTIQLGAGGSLGDAPGNAVEVTGLTVPSLTGVLVSGGATRVTGITGTDGWYKEGDEIILTVNFSGAVTVTGVPHLTLNVGGTSVSAEFSGTSGSPAASSQTFSYTVASGHNDPNGIDVTGLVLESGESVAGSSGTEATLNGTYSLSGIKIDTTVPGGFSNVLWENGGSSSDTGVNIEFQIFYTASTTQKGDTVLAYRSSDCSGSSVAQRTIPLGYQWNPWGGLSYISFTGDSPGVLDFSVHIKDPAGHTGPCVSRPYTLLAPATLNGMAAQSLERGPLPEGFEEARQSVVMGGRQGCVLSPGGELRCWEHKEEVFGKMAIDLSTIDLGIGPWYQAGDGGTRPCLCPFQSRSGPVLGK